MLHIIFWCAQNKLMDVNYVFNCYFLIKENFISNKIRISNNIHYVINNKDS